MANLVNNLGGAAGFGENFVPRNDDYYTTGIDLRTIFGSAGLNFFGTNYSYVSVNNNGNITLSDTNSGGLGTFTPFALANGGYAIIAPFFADVDTRLSGTGSAAPNQVTPTPGGTSRGSDLVWYDINSAGNGTLTVTWDDVGYYSYQTDKLNAFQLQIVGQGGGNFDIIFRYENIDWTTGGASGGSGGLGGTIARGGYSTGDGASWYELPQSGDQGGMLSLEDLPGNTGVDGYYKFSVRSGTAAGERMRGTATDDLLAGAGGNDTISGLAGNDYLIGNAGVDRLLGGAGDDTYSTDGIDVVVELAREGNDTVLSSSTYTLGANVENLQLTGTTAINGTGNTLDNVLAGNSANNTLDGKGGIDTVDYSLAQSNITVDLNLETAQYIYGQGYDTLLHIENVIGTNYGDRLTGTAGANVLNGGLGADTMIGGNGSDTYFVDNTSDVVTESTAGAAGGRDLVYSSLAAYTLGANVENGVILATGAASMTGNSLGNTIYAGIGNNVIAAGGGIDTLSYEFGIAGTAGVKVSLAVTTAQATGGSGTDRISGFENLIGSARNDRLSGSTGDNLLDGGSGADILSGGAGSDTLVGGIGRDALTGGAGDDVFRFTASRDTGATSAAADVISDFVRGQDLVDLSLIDAKASVAGNQAFTFIAGAAFSATNASGQLRVQGGVLYGSTDADADAEFAIALTGIGALSAADLVL
ncbi:nidogen-like domain-containing protein [Ramlibacter sp. PS3R-8]|uniref:nidogen-like domain-containing protein n=1 Tax=Ramlibacter sp. PS3R-8 TaxID=3133437 RepID=UPI0030AB8AB6